MKTNTLLAAVLGFVAGRVTAPELPKPPGYWDYDPALGTSRGALAGAKDHEAVVETELSYAAQRCQDWSPLLPVSPAHWARTEMGTPWYPRLGRRWPDGYRADFLYYLPAGVPISFPQPGEPALVRTGPGWVLVQDVPGWGWEVSEPLVGDYLLDAVKRIPTPWGLDDATRKEWPWGGQQPVAIEPEQLYPAGWWDDEPEQDPRYLLQAPWVNAYGFTPAV